MSKAEPQETANAVNREDWTLAVEVLTALAVIATLIVLIVEVRENSAVARVTAFQEINWEFNSARRDLINDPESLRLLLSLFRTGEFPELGSIEEQKLTSHLLNQFNTYNVAFHAYQTGVVGETEWQRLARNICGLLDLLPDGARDTQMRQLNEDFIAYIASSC